MSGTIQPKKSRIFRARQKRKLLSALAAVAALAFAAAPGAQAGLLQPGQGRTFFGLTDSGVTSQFTEFAEAVGKHPAVIETFRSWGSDLRGSIKRWQAAMARPMLHITTADTNDGHQIVTPRGIALGKGDHYLLNLNHYFWAHKMRAYLRPLGEPNRCLNVYAAYDCAGELKAGYVSPHWYKLAFRRMYVILHGGGKLPTINRRLGRIGLPPVNPGRGELPGGLPRAPIAVVWSPLPAGSPETHNNLPGNFFPGSRYVDWTGTDFYSDYPDWKSLNRVYSGFKGKPFTLTEWGVHGNDDRRFVRRLFVWVRRHPRCRMLVYYQDFGSTSSYRLENYPASLSVVRHQLSSPRFPPYAFEPPVTPPPPPGGVSP